VIKPFAYAMLFLFPLGYFSWRWLRSSAEIPNMLLGFYAYPLFLLTMLSAEGFSLPTFSISMTTANSLRALVHGLVACFSIRMALKHSTGWKIVPGTILALLTVMLMVFSAIFMRSGMDAFLRIALLLILLINFFILIPTTVGDEQTYFKELTRGSIFLAFYVAGLSTVVILLHGNYPEWTLRLGRPLNPSVLAELLALALIPAIFFKRSLIVVGGLFFALVATGSRFPLVFALVWLLVQRIKQVSVRRAVVGLALIICVSVGYVFWIQTKDLEDEGGILTRSDISSGRVLFWVDALDSIQSSPFWGRGDRVYLENTYTEEGEDIRPHNMLLENSMSYGIPAAFAAFAVYLVMGICAYRGWQNRTLSPQILNSAQLWLYLIAFQLGATMVETSSWLNLGDGGNVLLFLFISPGLARADAFLTSQRHTLFRRRRARGNLRAQIREESHSKPAKNIAS
jgi:O-antigen ligase